MYGRNVWFARVLQAGDRGVEVVLAVAIIGRGHRKEDVPASGDREVRLSVNLSDGSSQNARSKNTFGGHAVEGNMWIARVGGHPAKLWSHDLCRCGESVRLA
jgi:hypothetical protein